MKNKVGVLLANVGTPDSPAIEDVKRYLAEFLMDPYIVSLPWFLRSVLVKGLIAPLHSKKSSEKYLSIWGEEGSPLLFHMEMFRENLQRSMGDDYLIGVGMRYGNPSFQGAIQKMKSERVSHLILIPLYPQYCLATTESSIKHCMRTIAEAGYKGTFQVVSPFYRHPAFIGSFADGIVYFLENNSFDCLLFSFHGLPERQVKASGSGCLSSRDCCDQIRDHNEKCYRAQCFETARMLAARLALPEKKYRVAFQSRLGPVRWIGPHTSEILRCLPSQGIKRIVVACPSFVADCLETLNEIGRRGKQIFIGAGGESFTLVPSLNSSGTWVRAVSGMIRSEK